MQPVNFLIKYQCFTEWHPSFLSVLELCFLHPNIFVQLWLPDNFLIQYLWYLYFYFPTSQIKKYLIMIFLMCIIINNQHMLTIFLLVFYFLQFYHLFNKDIWLDSGSDHRCSMVNINVILLLASPLLTHHLLFLWSSANFCLQYIFCIQLILSSTRLYIVLRRYIKMFFP